MAETQAGDTARDADGRQAPVVRIFLSSPGDVADERTIARETIEGTLQEQPCYRHLKLEVIAWDDPDARIPMLANETPQESVNNARPRPSTCDIVVVILWARMGTPLPKTIRKPNGEPYLSGTEWEYLDAVDAPREPKPGVLVYRRTEETVIPARDRKRAAEIWEQLDRVDAFFARFRNPDGSFAGGVNEYATLDEFTTLLRQHLDELLHRRAPKPPPGGKVREIAAITPAAYVDWLRQHLARVELLGAKEGRSVTLGSVYVPALTMPPAGDAAAKQARRKDRPDEEAEDRKPIPLLQRLDQASLYVPAPAGAGKSTFCRWAVLQSITDHALTHPVPAPEGVAEATPVNLRGRLPLLVPLREFWRSMECGRGEQEWRRGDLERALATWIDASPPDGLTGGLLLAHLAAGTAFLLLDGLDEVPPTDSREHVTVFPRALLLSGLADALPAWHKAGNRFILTSRPYGLDDAGLHRLGLPVAALGPLPKKLRDLFVTRWFHTLGKTDKTAELLATLRDRGDLAPLVENPMLLTAICVLYDNGNRLPDDRYELYRSIVERVLYNRYPGDARQREPVEGRLQAIALGMHTGGCADALRLTPAAEISWIETEQLLADFAALNPVYERDRVEAAVRREELLNHSGLFVPRANDRAAFYHLSFQEFLAAQCLARTPGDVEPIFRERGTVAEWRPTLLFLLAAQIGMWGAQWGVGLLTRLLNGQDREAVKANPAPAVFIAEALDLCLAKNYAVPEELKDSFRRLALDAIEDEVELQARQALGLTLGCVGDPRIFDLREPRAYVEVPAGSYPYGSGGRTLEIAAPFWIGRYPVTNQQYAAFITTGGYSERRWWSEGGWAWLGNEKATEPRLWHDQRWNAPNQPVVGVSFWEAEAFCAWAGGRLPTEEEWEAAARGPNGLEYPWGGDWQDGICNTDEAGLGVTSPVGLFPRSRQRERGIEDLAGNVVEWCASHYGLTSKDGQNSRVLRGGSWLLIQDFARSANRSRSGPDYRDDFIGFRVLCVAHLRALTF
jgi:Uncharacterized conserved protein